MKYTVKEFAQEIRKLYPNDYDDLSDEKLVELWLKKYPNDKEKVDLSKEDKVQIKEPSNNTSGSFWGFLRTVIWIALIGGGIFLFYNSNKNKNYTSTDSTSGTEQSSSVSTVQSSPEEQFNSIPIKSDVSEYIDTCKVLEYYGLDDNIKTDIKRILSDPNPDPENKVGTNCGQQERRCKWCPNVFNVEGTYSSIYQNVKNYVKPEDIFTAYAVAFAGAFSPSKVNAELVRCCNLYRSGERYLCDYNTQEFCSEKCKTEYKYNH
ncbi:MAG: hypothetical protein WCH34_12885 [Bacteroidota bacterium]